MCLHLHLHLRWGRSHLHLHRGQPVTRLVELLLPPRIRAAALGITCKRPLAYEVVLRPLALQEVCEEPRTAVDEVYPLLSDLVSSLHKVSQLPPDFSGKVKLKAWLSKLHSMPASQRLSSEDVRQLLFDLDQSYQDFMGVLG